MANIKKIRELLTKAIFEVFEKGFFIFAEPVDDTGMDYRIRADIRFRGPMDGAMRISMSQGLAKIMAVNMLNLDDDEVTEALMADCLKECLNMICGSFVRKVDPDHVFHLEIPSFGPAASGTGSAEGPSGSSIRLVFDTEGGPFEVLLAAPGSLQ